MGELDQKSRRTNDGPRPWPRRQARHYIGNPLRIIDWRRGLQHPAGIVGAMLDAGGVQEKGKTSQI